MVERRSKLHEAVVNELQRLWPLLDIREEYKIGNNQFIDIYLPDFKIAIEIHGAQHYKYIPFFHGSEDDSRKNFEQQKLRDRKKEILCKQNSIFYIAINDSEKHNIKDLVSRIFRDYKESLDIGNETTK